MSYEETSKKEIFIVAITNPTPSTKYMELSCTAGIDRDGNWIRLYPVPLRRLELSNDTYRKYQWIEAEVTKSNKDPRPESMKCQFDKIKILSDVIDTKYNWAARKQIVLKSKTGVYKDFDKLLQDADKNNIKVSPAVFKPTRITKCIVEEKKETTVRHLIEKQNEINKSHTSDLFYNDQDFIPAQPMLLDIKYIFEDCNGKSHTMSVIDWEAYELFRNIYNKAGLNAAKEAMKKKYGNEFINKRDLYFILGTRKEDHLKGRGKNPFSIIGVFYPMKSPQMEFDL